MPDAGHPPLEGGKGACTTHRVTVKPLLGAPGVLLCGPRHRMFWCSVVFGRRGCKRERESLRVYQEGSELGKDLETAAAVRRERWRHLLDKEGS